jgi:hypothetical protein
LSSLLQLEQAKQAGCHFFEQAKSLLKPKDFEQPEQREGSQEAQYAIPLSSKKLSSRIHLHFEQEKQSGCHFFPTAIKAL